MDVVHFVSILCIVITGIICNTLAILSLCMKPTQPTIKDRVTLSLCISNLIQVLIGYTTELDTAYTGRFNETACKMEAFIIGFCTYAAIAHFVLLSIERYISIVTPYRADHHFKKGWIKCTFLLVAWVHGIVFALPPLFGWNSYVRTRPDSNYCSLAFQDRSVTSLAYFYVVLIFSFVLPITLMSVLFLFIIIDLRKASKRAAHRSGRSSVASRCSQRNVYTQGITLLLIILLYLLSWLPYVVICFCLFYDIRVSRLTEYFAACLVKSSTTTSPIVFCLVEKQFWTLICPIRNGDLFSKRKRELLLLRARGV